MTAMPNLKLLKNQKPVCSVALVAKPEFEHELSRTQCEPKPIAVIVVASQQASEQASEQASDQPSRAKSEPNGLTAENDKNEVIVARAKSVRHARLDQNEHREQNGHQGKIFHQ
jgi:hypothetical protein